MHSTVVAPAKTALFAGAAAFPRVGYSLSKLRNFSQSVTAASNDLSSVRA